MRPASSRRWGSWDNRIYNIIMNQHFVPRAYLKHFSEKAGKEYFINVYDKLEKRYFRANIKKVCAETDLYTLPQDTKAAKDVLAIEKIYGESIEPMFLRAHKILTNDNIFDISNSERIEIVLSILHFHMRNPRILKRAIYSHQLEITRLCENAKEKKTKGITYLDEDFSFQEWNAEAISEYFSNKTIRTFKEKHIIATGSIGSFHENAKLEVNIARGKSEFITSDNPLTTEDYITKLENPMSKSTQFTFPLDKKHSLRLYHDNARELNSIRRGFMPNGSVSMVNSTVFEQSSRFLFGDKEAFDEYFQIQEFLSNDSFELRTEFVKQALEIGPSTGDSKEAYKVLEDYYKKYTSQGFISHEEEQEMMHKIREISISVISKRVN
jgi:hypothetical protein